MRQEKFCHHQSRQWQGWKRFNGSWLHTKRSPFHIQQNFPSHWSRRDFIILFFLYQTERKTFFFVRFLHWDGDACKTNEKKKLRIGKNMKIVNNKAIKWQTKHNKFSMNKCHIVFINRRQHRERESATMNGGKTSFFGDVIDDKKVNKWRTKIAST